MPLLAPSSRADYAPSGVYHHLTTVLEAPTTGATCGASFSNVFHNVFFFSALPCGIFYVLDGRRFQLWDQAGRLFLSNATFSLQTYCNVWRFDFVALQYHFSHTFFQPETAFIRRYSRRWDIHPPGGRCCTYSHCR